VAKGQEIFVDFESIEDAMNEENKKVDPGFIDFDKSDDYVYQDEEDDDIEIEDPNASAVRKKEDYTEDQKNKDLFNEQFNHVDVINKNVVKGKHAADNEKIIELDKMDLIQFYEERFKKDSFEYQFVEMKEESPDSIDALLKENFKDFLIYKKLSGNLSGLSHANRIPSDKLKSSNKTVEVKDDKDDKKHTKQIITHRNQYDEVDFIEVICNCGERTIIRFDYDENANYEEEDKKNLYIEEKEEVEPINNQTEDVFDELGISDMLDDSMVPPKEDDGHTSMDDFGNVEDEMEVNSETELGADQENDISDTFEDEKPSEEIHSFEDEHDKNEFQNLVFTDASIEENFDEINLDPSNDSTFDEDLLNNIGEDSTDLPGQEQ
jgi:hypothetical protein